MLPDFFKKKECGLWPINSAPGVFRLPIPDVNIRSGFVLFVARIYLLCRPWTRRPSCRLQTGRKKIRTKKIQPDLSRALQAGKILPKKTKILIGKNFLSQKKETSAKQNPAA
jgi:hypothetical protein